jgi:hypothetical protein
MRGFVLLLAAKEQAVTDHDQGTKQDAGKPASKRPGRSWTERFTGQIRYRRYTDLDAGGRPSILFKFELAPGQGDLPQGVYDILHELKHLDRNHDFPNGGGSYPTGLAFSRDKKHGRVWRLPDNSTGRTAADIIDGKLRDLAITLEQEGGQGHRR